MKKILFIIILNIFLLMLTAYNSFAQHGNNGWRGSKYHYGTYYTSPQEGQYGERKAVRTERDARKVLLKHFSSGRETIGKIRERDLFFEVEIKGRDNKTVDIIIIDKRTGRIRSTY